MPAGAVNVHGHLHAKRARARALVSTQHLNVNVEQTGYRPLRLSELVMTAGALLAGDVKPLATTAHTVAMARRHPG